MESFDPIFNVKDKTIIVTGASSGLGAAFAEILASRGAKVVIAARRIEKLEKLQTKLSEKGFTVKSIQCDVTKSDDVSNLFIKTEQEFGDIDVVVNNAGASSDEASVPENMTDEMFQQTISVNLVGLWYCCREAGQRMLKRGKGSMKWLIGFYSSVASIPPSIDSSSVDIIREGLNEYKSNNQPQGVPMINSASLERLSVLDDVSQNNTFVMITAAGFDSMPEDDEERLSNVSKMILECDKRDIPLSKIHVDPLLFPISVDKRFGNHFLDSIRGIRKKFGQEIHISGGMSNVSFGLPERKLINDTLIKLSIDAGANSGIVNPLESDIQKIQNMDLDSGPVKIASDMLLGNDEYCMNFISQFREGNLKSYK